MPKSHSAAAELAPLLDGSSAGELIPELVRHGLQQLIELEVAAVLGADRYERSEERLGHRNGYRPRLLTTQVGAIDLRIPKLHGTGVAQKNSAALMQVNCEMVDLDHPELSISIQCALVEQP